MSTFHRTSEERKEAILSLIRGNPGQLGPSRIAELIGSTSKSVAVTICHMRAEGYLISRCTPGKPVEPGTGYRLLEEPENA